MTSTLLDSSTPLSNGLWQVSKQSSCQNSYNLLSSHLTRPEAASYPDNERLEIKNENRDYTFLRQRELRAKVQLTVLNEVQAQSHQVYLG